MNKTYAGSGLSIANTFKTHLSSFNKSVYLASTVNLSQQQALQAAKDANCKYLFIPLISHWEPRATSWSGRPNQASVVVLVLDVNSGEVLIHEQLVAVGKSYATERPEFLMNRSINIFVNKIYGAPPPVFKERFENDMGMSGQ